MTDFGIDVSHHNQVDDWQAVHGNNISFVCVKVTESTGFTDDAAGKHADGARAAGIHAGGYHFARATDVTAQVQHFAANLRAHDLLTAASLAPMLDMEASSLEGNANAFVTDFIATLRAETGIRRVLVYANLNWWQHILRPDDWADADVSLWIARFNGKPGRPGWSHPRLALHQHSDRGVVPGIPAHVDRDATVGDRTLDSVLIG